MTVSADGSTTGRKPALPAVAVFLAGIVVLFNAARLACVSRDGTHYVTFARQLSREPAFYLKAHRSQPGYSASILAVQSLIPAAWRADPVRSGVLAGQLIACLGFVATVPLVFALTRRLFDRRAATAAAFLAALWPAAAQLGGDVLSDMPHLAIFLVALLAADTALRRPFFWRSLFTGVLCGLAYLFRQESLSLPVSVIAILCVAAARRALVPTAALRGGVGLILGFALAVAPYVGITGSLFHKKSLGELLQGTPRLSTTAPTARDAADTQRATAMPRAVSHGIDMLDGWARSGRYVFSTLAFAAVLIGVRARATGTSRLLFLILLLHCGAVALRGSSFGVISSRYMLIPAALTLPWSAAGLCCLVDWIALRKAASRGLAWMVAWFVIAGITLPYALRTIHAQDVYLRDAGQWLRTAANPEDEVLAEHRACQTVFYSNVRWNEWPGEDWPIETILAHDAEASPRWYVHFDGARGTPEIDDSCIETILHHPRWPGAKLAHRAGPRGREVRIIRLRP